MDDVAVKVKSNMLRRPAPNDVALCPFHNGAEYPHSAQTLHNHNLFPLLVGGIQIRPRLLGLHSENVCSLQMTLVLSSFTLSQYRPLKRNRQLSMLRHTTLAACNLPRSISIFPCPSLSLSCFLSSSYFTPSNHPPTRHPLRANTCGYYVPASAGLFLAAGLRGRQS